MRIPVFLKSRITGPLGALLLMLAAAGYLFPESGFYDDWVARYGSSGTGAAGCSLCHGSSRSIINGYGRAIQQQAGSTILAKILAVEGLNSDSDPGGASNLAEINAGAQPGWTSGGNTVYYVSGGTLLQPPPSGLLLDPVTAPPPSVPEIDVSTAALEFGGTTVGTTRTLTKAIQNVGNADLTVSSVTVSGNPDFVVDAATPATPFTVAAGGSRNVTVRYAPSAEGDDTGELGIGSNDSDEGTVSVTLHGTGTPPALICDIDVTPLSWAAGSVQVGQTAGQVFTIGNTGTGPCSVTSVTTNPTSLTEFALGTLPSRPFTVQAGANVQVQVNYTPVNSGTDNGSLQVRSSDPDEGTVTIPLSGTGNVPTSCSIQVSAMALNFGGVPLGSSASRSTTLTNTGDADCTVQSAQLTVSSSSDFTIDTALPSLPVILAPGVGLQISLTYTPAEQGDDTGALMITSSDPDQPSVAVNLTGSGVQVAQQCDIQVSPLSLDFGDVAVGSGSTLTATVSNAGQGPCNVGWQLVSDGGDFALTQTPPAALLTIPPEGSVAISVDYAPSGSGDDRGSLQISSDDPAEAAVPVTLSGGGFIPGGMVDLGVSRFEVKRQVQLAAVGTVPQEAVSIRVVFKNNGETDQPRLATVTGMQGEVEVYQRSQMVSAPLDRGRRGSATFPPYTPTALGLIRWTIVIADDVPEGSTAQAATEVLAPKGRSAAGAGAGVVNDDEEHDDEEQEAN